MPPAHTAPYTASAQDSLTGKAVLIADDDHALASTLAGRCRSQGMQAETTNDGLRTLLAVAKSKPDLLILDLNLPDVDGFRVVERLTDPKFPPLPVIVLTGRSDAASVRRCEALGVLYVHKGSNTWDELLPVIQKVFSDKQQTKQDASAIANVGPHAPHILLVDDDPVVRKMLSSGLQQEGVHVSQASSGMQGFWLALREQPDLIITDHNMEQGSGHYILSRIKSTPSTRHIPVIVFTGESLTEGQQAAMGRDLQGRGQAAAFLTKPINVQTVLKVVAQHIPLPRRV